MSRVAQRTYGALGALIAVLAYGQMTLIEEPASLHTCLEHYAGKDDLKIPAVIAYAVYKGALWPISLAWALTDGSARPRDWVLARYDPFEGYCE